MIVKIRCSDSIGKAVLMMLTAMAQTAREGELSFEQLNDSAERTVGGGPRTHYWAKLPKQADGTFDMATVDETVRRNLEELKAHTVNGIIYSDIVQKTLAGELATEPQLAAARMMKRGSSQRAVQVLYNMGLIDRGPIKVSEEG